MALSKLQTVVAEFCSCFDRKEWVPGRIAALHYQLASALFEAEQSGIPRKSPQLLDIVRPWYERISRHPFLQRIQTWPKGYPGDWVTIEMLLQPHLQMTTGDVLTNEI